MQSGSTPEIQDYFKDLKTPSSNDMELNLEGLVQQGILSPEEAQTILMEESEMTNISLDPRMKQAQMEALAGLQNISDSGGMTLTDDANLAKIENDEAIRSRGAREAILQNAQARGAGGSGLEIMAQLQNQQDSATRASSRDLDVAAQAQARALDALMQGGNLAGQMGAQDFSQQAQTAQAQDAIAAFNAKNRQGQQNLNTAARNQAQAQNLATTQGISDANVNVRNQQQQYNKNLPQQQFDNEIQKRSGQAGILSANQQAQGANSKNKADATNQMIGTGVAVGSLMASDEDLKKKVNDPDMESFLNNLSAKQYQYKDESFGEGEQLGIMAQDLEKSEVGDQIVEDTSVGKMVDTTKSTGPILAALAYLNERLNKMEGR